MPIMDEKLKKHLEELSDATSGGSHDAVTFSGKGLSILGRLFKSTKKKEDYEDSEEDKLEDELGEEEETQEKSGKKKVKKSVKSNGGPLEEEDTDMDDPGQEGEEEIITNKGKRIKGEGVVKKNAPFFDERRFEKSFDEFETQHEEVLDASDALSDLTRQMKYMAKSVSSGIGELQESVRVLAKGLEHSLQAQASMAAELELIKKQPASAPNPGFVVMTKNASGKVRTLKKSEIEDAVTNAMNQGLVEASALVRLGQARTQNDLIAFVDALPADVREML